jgi:hypothetical protein
MKNHKEILRQKVLKNGWEEVAERIGGVDILYKHAFNNDYNEFLNLFNNLELVQCEQEPNWTLYRFEKGKNIMIYDKENETVYVNHHIIWSFFRNGIGFNYGTAAELGHGKYICMTCADNSETYESLIKMITLVQKNEDSKNFGGVVPNFKNNDSRILSRRITSRVFVRLCQVISGFKYIYFNGPTIHRRKNVARFKPLSSGYAFQSELLCNLTYLGYLFVEVTIDNHDREEGKSRAFNYKNFLSVSHSLLQILFMRIRNFLWPSISAIGWDDNGK